jgi:AraC-like DNA-binding protein
MARQPSTLLTGCDPDALPAQERPRHIRVASGDEFGPTARELFGRVSIRFIKDARQEASLTSADLARCRLSRIAASAHHVTGERVVERSYDSDNIKIILQLHGEALFEQSGIRVALHPSTWVAYDPTRAYSLANTTSVQQLMLQIPRHSLAPKMLNALVRPRSVADDGAGMPSILAAMMRATLAEVGRLDDTTRLRVGESLVQLAVGLIEQDREVQEEGRAASLDILRRRVQDYMKGHVDSPSIDFNEIAKRIGCSRRYLFRAFEAEKTTPSRYLWELRLTRSRDLLVAPSQAKRSISDIGFACGFSSSAHFSRAFRARFGCSPRAYRLDPTTK